MTAGRETPAGQGLLDEALEIAEENFRAGEAAGLLYSRFEGHRCLALVHFRRGELEEAERICSSASDIVSNTESRVSQLWLGPLYIDVLIAAAKHLKNEDKADEAATKLKSARELLETYRRLAAECQSRRFKREAARLEQELKVAD